MVSLIQAVILSIVQGITEWFPVSSSGHLALFQKFFGFQNLSYDVFLHFPSIIAVIYVFKKDILDLLRFNKENWGYIGLLLIAMIPVFILGILFKDFVIASFSNMLFLGFFFFVSGGLIYLTKFIKEEKKKINWFDSLLIGLFQAIAIFPGISRSGATISGSLFRGLKKEQAIKFSFLLAIPVMLGASLVEATHFITEVDYFILIISFVITFLVSIFTIKLLLRIVYRENFWMFGVYDMLLGGLVIIWSLF